MDSSNARSLQHRRDSRQDPTQPVDNMYVAEMLDEHHAKIAHLERKMSLCLQEIRILQKALDRVRGERDEIPD